MNRIDCHNFKLIIELQEKFKKEWIAPGGTYEANEIWPLPTEELKQQVEQYKKQVVEQAKPRIREIIDHVFKVFSDYGWSPENNTIVLYAATAYDGYTIKVPDEEILDRIDFDNYRPKYNKFYFPVNIYDKEIRDKVKNEIRELRNLLNDIGTPTAEGNWLNSDALNEYWYGCIGVMKDYKVVSFVIRGDGILCDNDTMDCSEKFPWLGTDNDNHILFDLGI